MKIAVCIKQVPAEREGATDLKLGLVIRTGRRRMNPYDAPAVEAALQLKERFGGRVDVFSMGPQSAGEVIGEAMSMGADGGWLMTDRVFAGADTLATARTLAAGMATVDQYDLIICGLKTTDGDTGQVGPALAALLEKPFAGRVESFDEYDEQNGLTLHHKVDQWLQTVRLKLPGVISVVRENFVPRIPGLKARMKKKIINEIHFSDLAEKDENLYGLKGSPTRIKRAYVPERPPTGQILEAGGEKAAEIVLSAINEAIAQGGLALNTMMAAKTRDYGKPSPRRRMREHPWVQGSALVSWLETDSQGRLTGLSMELAGESRRLGAEAGFPAWGIFIEESEPADLDKLDLDRIFIYQRPGGDFNAQDFADALVSCVKDFQPSTVLLGATDRGKDVAPLAAARLGTGLTADCVELRMDDGDNLLQIRPAFGGNVMAEILTPLARPQFATVRQGAFKAAPLKAFAGPEIVRLKHQSRPDSFGLEVLERTERPEASSLDEARIILAVGCGFKSAADLDIVQALARAKGAEVGATRSVVERGWMPPEAQIGLSGRSVSPSLLITLGVSGSVQFLAGIRGAERLVAINNDPAAPIFSAAQVCLCADVYQVLPFLEKYLSQCEE
ncbi:hypothetical protein C4J81_13135 [Deltaproteobacteria bacterium Smac51]|nr:hypothetical protein C4J81_13135 [Deltaproteobacteria bacterium Smac51]